MQGERQWHWTVMSYSQKYQRYGECTSCTHLMSPCQTRLIDDCTNPWTAFCVCFCRLLRVLHQVFGRGPLCISGGHHPVLLWGGPVLWLWTCGPYRHHHHPGEPLLQGHQWSRHADRHVRWPFNNSRAKRHEHCIDVSNNGLTHSITLHQPSVLWQKLSGLCVEGFPHNVMELRRIISAPLPQSLFPSKI